MTRKVLRKDPVKGALLMLMLLDTVGIGLGVVLLLFVEPCETLGDKGDIILCDLTQYLCILKRTGLRSAVSAHLWFDYDTLAYKWVLRVSGLPLWASTSSRMTPVGHTQL